ncbi:hypothetical protein Droror1_Dr00019867, partial [Drosera rotundifolia]
YSAQKGGGCHIFYHHQAVVASHNPFIRCHKNFRKNNYGKTMMSFEMMVEAATKIQPMKAPIANVLFMMSILLLLAMSIALESNAQHIANRRTSSLFINKVAKARSPGCKGIPGACGLDKICCGTTCVDMTIETNHCGACGLKCPFTWKCCDGVCANIKFNPSHCGKCGNKCGGGSKVCMYGMCNYVHEIPPWTTGINTTDATPT